MISQLLRYEPDTGKLFWLPRTLAHLEQFSPVATQAICDTWNRKYAGSLALRHSNPQGYLCGRIFDQMCVAHRAAWAVTHGEWPDRHLDHINSDRADNRLSNLRLASHAQNMQCARPKRGCSSRFRGVSWSARDKVWVARIYVNGKGVYVCHSECEIEAAKAYDIAAKKVNGAFAYQNLPEGTS